MNVGTVAVPRSAAMDADKTEKVSAIRSAIDAKLREDGVYQQIRELIASKATATLCDESSPNEDALIREVLESELVQKLLQAVKLDREAKQACDDVSNEEDDEENTPPHSTGEPALYIRLPGGRAFLDHLTQDDSNEDDGVVKITEKQIGLVRQFFRVSMMFQGQRMASQDVACCVEPKFNDHFRFHVAKRKTRTGRTKTGGLYEIDVVTPWEALCLVDEPVHIVLTKVTKKVTSYQHSTGPVWQELRRELLATHRLDWRRVLASTSQLVHMPIQLTDVMKVPVGTLDLRLDVLNFPRTATIAKDVAAFLNKETMEKNALSHAFYRYAKDWWQEYRSEMDALEANVGPGGGDGELSASVIDRRMFIRASSRLVKLFAEDDEGRFQSVCKFVHELRAPQVVRSPSEAARFVALLPHESTSKVGGVADETWRTIPTTLAVGKGDVQDHAVLLASLLLGCGLDAYVCIGTASAKKNPSQHRTNRANSEVGHVWVMTRDPDRPSDPSGVLFWESLTGERCYVRERSSEASAGGASRHGYVSVDCVFNGTRFYANLHPRQRSVSDYVFDFDDETSWKSLDPRRISDLPHTTTAVSLVAADVPGATVIEQQWTATLKRDIASKRRAEGLVTKWSEELGFYLQPALNSYEMERLYHVPQVENDLFQQTIKRFVKEGFTFQAVPIMFKTPSTDGVMDALDDNAIARKIIGIQGRAAQFGLAVRCFAYPEKLFAVWLMVAVSYQS